MKFWRRLIKFIKSDIELRTTTVWDLDGKEKIDGFYFMSKQPFSKSYQWHAAIGLEYTYKILSHIQNGIKEKKRGILIEISRGMWYERVYIWRGSFKKAERQIFDMIKEIQHQY